MLRSKKELGIVVLVALIAVFVRFTMIKRTPYSASLSSQPYYSMSFFNPCIAFSMVYTCVAHLWCMVVWGGRVPVNPLPPPPYSSTTNTKKLAIVTGANTGIGWETARTLVVDYGYEVVLACRSKDKAILARDEINNQQQQQATNNDNNNNNGGGGQAIVLDQPLDLSDFRSVRTFAQEVQTKYETVDVLINNAGRNTSGKSKSISGASELELDLLFQSNFLGHFVLTQELLGLLQNNSNGGDGGRVVNLASVMHQFSGTRVKDNDFWRSVALYSEDPPPETPTYAASKLAAVLFTQELNRRYSNSNNDAADPAAAADAAGRITSMAVNPGSCASDIWRGFPEWLRAFIGLVFLTPQQGSVPVVAAAVQEKEYYRGDDKDDDDSSSDSSYYYYLQPYWQAFSSAKTTPLFPAMEILGPYVGYVPTVPRLPLVDGGREAALALWDVSEELTRA